MTQGPTILLDETGVRIPGDLLDLAAFRRWTQSDAFPETGRIDWIGAQVEIDMSPENLNFHASPKVAITRDLSERTRIERALESVRQARGESK